MNIAIVQLGRIGDMILSTSVIKPIKEHFPYSDIYIICGATNAQILDNNPYIKDVLIYDKRPIKFLQFIRKLKNINFNYYIDPKDHFSTESYYLAKIANATTKIGFNDLKHNVFSLCVPSTKENMNLHFVERLLSAIKPLGIKTDVYIRPEIYLTDVQHQYANQYLSDNKIKEFVLINISAGNSDRMWVKSKWIKLIKEIKENDIKIILSSEKKHLQMANCILKETDIYYFSPTSLMNLAALLEKAKLIITPDTSLVHLASAFDIPVISMTGNYPDNIIKFFPLSTHRQVITPNNYNSKEVSDIEVKALIDAFEIMSKIVL